MRIVVPGALAAFAGAGLLIFLCLASGCSDKDRIPSGVIPQEEMGKILWDMIQADQFSSVYLAKDSAQINWKDSLRIFRQDSLRAGGKDSAALTAKGRGKDSARLKAEDSLRISKLREAYRAGLKTKNLRLYQQVLQLHRVTLEEFRKSYQYYLERPDITKIIADSMQARGNRLRTESYSHPSATDTAKKSPVLLAPGQAKPGIPAVLPPGQGPGAHPQPSSPFLLRSRQVPGKTGRDSTTKYPKP